MCYRTKLDENKSEEEGDETFWNKVPEGVES